MNSHSKTIFLLLFLCLGYNNSWSQGNPIDSLTAVFDTVDEKTKGKAIIQFVIQFMQKSEIEKAYQYIKEIEDIGFERKDTVILINCNALLAEYFWRKSDYHQGIVYGQKAISLAETHPRFEGELAKGLQTVGTIHLYQSNIEEALSYYQKAIPIYQKNDQMVSVAGLLNNSGVVYMDAGDIRKEEHYYDSALHYFDLVIQMKERARPSTILNALGNAGSIYVRRGKYELAQNYYDQWTALESQDVNPTNRAMNFGHVGIMYREMGQYELSEKYFMEGLGYAKEIDMAWEVMEYHRNIARLYELQGRYKEALDYHSIGTAMKDSIFDVEKVNAISELETKYQVAKKEQEVLAATSELERKERFQMFLMVVIGLVLTFSVTAFILVKQRHKLQQELLSQEIDNLRIQINEFLGSQEKVELDVQKINEQLPNPISEREFEVLQLAVTDLNNREIAEKVYVSVNTVKFHLKNIYIKLGVSNRKEALQAVLNPARA